MDFPTEQDLFQYLEEHAYAALFSDILDGMGYRSQAVSPEAAIRPLSEAFVSAGRAVTLLNAPDANEEEPFDLVIKCIDAIQPGSVMVATGSERLESGIMGELTATALRARRCRGAIVNGYTRDSRKLINMGYPTFAWGSSPIDTTGRVRVVKTNVPVVIGGVTIAPGDLVFADTDGIVVVPRSVEKEVIDRVIERLNTENKVRKELAEGRTMAEVWSRYHVL